MKNLYFVLFALILFGCANTFNIQNDFPDVEISLNPPKQNQKIVYKGTHTERLNYFFFGQSEPEFNTSDFLNSEIKKYNGSGICNLKIKNEIPTQTYLMNSLISGTARLITSSSSVGIQAVVMFVPYLFTTEEIIIEYQVYKNE